MIACGINPDDFGTYDQRAKAQSAAREDFQKRRCEQLAKDGQSHPAPCKFKGNPSSCTCYRSAEALESEKAQKWLYMNSQSGHLSLNHFYQGKREDPCSGHPPSRNADGSMNGGGLDTETTMRCAWTTPACTRARNTTGSAGRGTPTGAIWGRQRGRSAE